MNQRAYALITGASSGIGREFARLLAKQGYDLILVARREERLRKLQGEMNEQYQGSIDCKICTADLSDPTQCGIVCELVERLPVQIFINNAGLGDCGTFLETDADRQLQMIDVNIRAMHHLMKWMLGRFEKENRGYLLNVGSSAGLLPGGPYLATYYATKSYVVSLTRAVAYELKAKHSNVYVGCLCPGPVSTEFDVVAGVKNSLPGMNAAACVAYAYRKMQQRKTVIIPSLSLRVGLAAGRILPQKLLLALVAHQQKKKLVEK